MHIGGLQNTLQPFGVLLVHPLGGQHGQHLGGQQGCGGHVGWGLHCCGLYVINLRGHVLQSSGHLLIKIS